MMARETEGTEDTDSLNEICHSREACPLTVDRRSCGIIAQHSFYGWVLLAAHCRLLRAAAAYFGYPGASSRSSGKMLDFENGRTPHPLNRDSLLVAIDLRHESSPTR